MSPTQCKMGTIPIFTMVHEDRFGDRVTMFLDMVYKTRSGEIQAPMGLVSRSCFPRSTSCCELFIVSAVCCVFCPKSLAVTPTGIYRHLGWMAWGKLNGKKIRVSF